MPLFLALLRSETANDPARTARILAGVRAYQDAPRSAPQPPMPVVARSGRVMLRDYGGSGPPLLVVPSLINPPGVLDLSPERSLLRWLSCQGLRPLLVDWGEPSATDRALDLAQHVALLLPLLDWIDEPPLLLGYCLGGTLALAVAALLPVRALVLLAAPWRFSGFPNESRASVGSVWQAAAPLAEEIGALPMEALQSIFWQIDPGRTVGKFERFAMLDPTAPAAADFVTLEDWANAGAPIPYAAARELAVELFGSDRSGRGEWCIQGHAIDPATLTMPVLNIVSASDRIVPAASAAPLGLEMRLSEGHVGMVVGGRAQQVLWKPLARWLSAQSAI